MITARVSTRSLGLGWVPVEYACREADGSLKPVPPGKTRAELYCPQCTALRCLFAPGYYYDDEEDTEPEEQEKDPIKVTAGRCKAQANRAAGLSPTGEPLREVCWNCAALRMNGDGKYICLWHPDEPARGRWTMENSRPREPCDFFEVRLVMEIPPL